MANPFLPGGFSPFFPGGNDPLRAPGLILDGEYQVQPNGQVSQVNQNESNFLSKIADGSLWERFGLYILGIVFVVVGLYMLKS